MWRLAGRRTLAICVMCLSLLIASVSARAEPDGRLVAATTDGKRIVIRDGGGNCMLANKDTRRRMGLLGATTSAAAGAVPAFFIVPSSAPHHPKGAVESRLVVVDLICRQTQTLRTFLGEPGVPWYGALAEAARMGYLDIRQDDGRWGSWNLRMNKWDPPPCCASPAHSLIQAEWQRRYSGPLAPAPGIWNSIQPAVWIYLAVVSVCFLIAIGQGYRGWMILPQALVVMPLKGIWLLIVLVVVANLYALAGMLGSGGISSVARGAYTSATRALRR